MTEKKEIVTLRDIVLVELAPMENKTKGGIIIPISGRKIKSGTVKVVGKGTPFYTMKLKVGEKVRFYEGSGIPVIKDSKQHLLLKEMQCFAVEEDE
ncbi:co-chaperone GroES [Aquimarina algiphila]|uniref:10 kDa chaperonin n=1 Tax=Aquimarina algiphila TaxID=2047982 RepID=A0A554VRM1_9FLAO|nr:co-chaperone GroES [Aquimarina algiphila]TSE11300.1 co-chaperone GroES [Aquimarina algiphila]